MLNEFRKYLMEDRTDVTTKAEAFNFLIVPLVLLVVAIGICLGQQGTVISLYECC
jgi:hypothetical protein